MDECQYISLPLPTFFEVESLSHRDVWMLHLTSTFYRSKHVWVDFTTYVLDYWKPKWTSERCMGWRVHSSRSRMNSSSTAVYMITHNVFIYTYIYVCMQYRHGPIPVPQFVAQIFSAWACRVQCWSLSSETWNKSRLSDSSLAHNVTYTWFNPAYTWIDLKGIKTIVPKRLPHTVYENPTVVAQSEASMAVI